MMPETPHRASGIFGDEGWFRTGRLRLLSYDTAVHSNDPALIELVEDLYAPLLTEGEPAHAILGQLLNSQVCPAASAWRFTQRLQRPQGRPAKVQ